jgi:hypothetical protein
MPNGLTQPGGHFAAKMVPFFAATGKLDSLPPGLTGFGSCRQGRAL